METADQIEYKRFLDPSVVSKISGLELRARLIVEGFLLGLHKSPYHGFSIEFSQHRPYMQGDSPKDIDWKVYGKSDRFYVKQYEEETNLKSYILLDVSKSMTFSSAGRISKLGYASQLAASLSYLMLKQKDAVSLSVYADSIKKYLPPNSSRIYLKEIISVLSKIVPDSNTNTSFCLNQISDKITKRGLVVIISDFFDDAAKVISAIKKFRFYKNEVIVFQLLDPIERNFSFQKDAIFKDMETGEEIITQPYQIQKSYRDAMDTFLNKIKSECLRNGVEYNLIDTSTLFDKALFTYLQKRSRLL
ncbi:MAG: DUF58 domain-containing protein [Ignavibacteria bacterium CG_4_8_14_3_um_filter_37_9]|nr:MAG: hypothetical protein AUJ54_13470 [Ignavibacteria bacterium CG1_02_37_35]PIW99268.1 MAG: DUF58 domain-containing protein [Ignavibacteria bacterium CG_4_8_14_3_um_filter_37_9]PIX93588.1 MAG: DUF58 domain-containing protein [Ignavibacteria bacterium CG_4_10_14_3_um_filter_37_18]